ncbi:MAG TPA: type I-E CRISPR-associated protein Cas6/Cse3/CasE [Thermomicrobiales bacterium]|jgi:CRISPR system Cascade subunit CasE
MSELYLARLFLNPRSRAVQHDLANCHALHQRVMSGFPDGEATGDARERFGVLYRVDGGGRSGRIVLLVQARIEPDWARLPAGYLAAVGGDPANPEVKPIGGIYERIREGTELAFRLRANPTKRDAVSGKRVELAREEQQVGWLERKGADGGFVIPAVTVRPSGQEGPVVRVGPAEGGGKQVGWRRQGDEASSRLTFGAVVFEGVLRVTDADRLRAALATGIGSGKAYGFGLLSVAPVRG